MIITDLSVNVWPHLLELLLLPKVALDRIGGKHFLQFSRSVLFKMEPSLELDLLTRALSGGMIGCVKVSPTHGCFVRIIVLMYTPTEKMYIGFVPLDQNRFIHRLHDLIRKRITKLIKRNAKNKKK